MATLSHSSFALFLAALCACGPRGTSTPPDPGTEPTLIVEPVSCFKPYPRQNQPINEQGGASTAAIELARRYLGGLNESVAPASLGIDERARDEACQLVTRSRKGWARVHREGALVAAAAAFGARSVLVTVVGAQEHCMNDTVTVGGEQVSVGTATCFERNVSVTAVIVNLDGSVGWKHGRGASRATPSHPPQDVHRIVAGAFAGVPLGNIVGAAR